MRASRMDSSSTLGKIREKSYHSYPIRLLFHTYPNFHKYMDALLKLLAVLTILWSGWMYFKYSDSETELRKARNELKVAMREKENVQREVEEYDTIVEKVNALREQNQQLEKDIEVKIKERNEQTAREHRGRLAAKDALDEKRRAREAEIAKQREQRLAQLAQEEEAQRESNECEAVIKSANDTLQRYLPCHAFCPNGVQDYGRIDVLKKKWTLTVQTCLKAANSGNEKKLKSAMKTLESTADALNRLSEGQNASCLSDAAKAIEAAKVILKAKKRLKELNQGR